MDATLKLKAEQLAGEFANQAQSLDDLGVRARPAVTPPQSSDAYLIGQRTTR